MRALVTGAEQGLGATVAQQLSFRKIDVTRLSRHAVLEGKDQIDAELDAYLATGHLDECGIIINNFGINHLSWIGETPEADEAIYRVNVMGPYWVINWFVAHGYRNMRVVNVASQTYRVAQRTTSLYCASKAALVQLTKVMARELAPSGWIINAIAPGKITDTTMAEMTDAQVLTLRGWDKETADGYAHSLIPMERFTTCGEVTEAILKLLGMPAYVNGTVLDMTGGV